MVSRGGTGWKQRGQAAGHDAGSGPGQREQGREAAVSEHVFQVKLTSVADGLHGSGKEETRVGALGLHMGLQGSQAPF